jgi:TonB family protein
MIKLTVYILFILTAAAFSEEDSLITYFDSGSIESIIHYKNSVRDGEAIFYWENGNTKQELSYFNGRVDGLVRNYNENGLIREMYSIVNGKREGPTSYFDSSGVYVDDIFYTEGMLDVEIKPLRHSMSDDKLTENKTKKQTKKKINTEQPLPPTIEEERDLEEDPAFYLSVEVMPEPIGGMKAIYKKISYPKQAKENKIEGTVIRVFIDRDGEVLDAELVEGIGYGCDESARLAIFYHRFKPGLQRGQRVKVQMDIPVEFKIEKKNNKLNSN